VQTRCPYELLSNTSLKVQFFNDPVRAHCSWWCMNVESLLSGPRAYTCGRLLPTVAITHKLLECKCNMRRLGLKNISNSTYNLITYERWKALGYTDSAIPSVCEWKREIFCDLIQFRLPVFKFVGEQTDNYSKSIAFRPPRKLFSWHSFIKGLQVCNAKEWLEFPLHGYHKFHHLIISSSRPTNLTIHNFGHKKQQLSLNLITYHTHMPNFTQTKTKNYSSANK
jgi:hypothetical protein